MDNVDNFNLVKSVNDLLVTEGLTLDEVAKRFKMKRKDIIFNMKREGFIFDKVEGYFIKEETLIKRIERLEVQQKEILELLSSTERKSLKIDSSVLEGDIIPRTFKLYKTTSLKFTQFCNEHRELKMQEIITVALEEFMEKNKN
ncbi:hypothetical protein CYK67_14505 [Clostridium perfringens]|nr:hypothetical protein CYK68_14645 [Clostridium perfringens]PWX10484.1 hypothetical protein CYK67_14505 [Clostridium perfringens]PWX14710.1 hypothetical protein CYK66_14775 [Clostridium perfringens]